MVVTFIKALHTTATTCPSLTLSESLSYQRSKSAFLSEHPSYHDPSLSALRKHEFARLHRNGGSVYLDYTGAALPPASLLKSHSKWLRSTVAGNPHSTSPASLLSSAATEEARSAVLKFFDADPREYDVVWTANATGGFRIVGETYDWEGKTVLIPRDAHNSLNSLARKAQAGGGGFEFVEFDAASSGSSGLDTISKEAYHKAFSSNGEAKEEKGLIFFTGQSNITGAKLDFSLLPQAKAFGWDVGLDAAALAPSTRISLRENSAIDFMVVSMYKIVGYPTGLGALIMKKGMYSKMTKKSTFFGGNIIGITMDRFEFSLVEGVERFEDGTGHFGGMAAVKPGLEWAGRWMPKYAKRNKILLEWLVGELDSIYYPAAVSEIGEKSADSTLLASTTSSSRDCSMEKPSLSRSSSPSSPSPRRGVKLLKIGGPLSSLSTRGSTLPLVFSSPSNQSLNYRFVIFAASTLNISLRGGPCMCNPGASSAVMQRGLITDLHASSLLAVADVGIVRLSLGAPTNFKDCWRLVEFCRKLTDQVWVEGVWKRYVKEMGVGKAGRLSNDIDELQARATRKREQ